MKIKEISNDPATIIAATTAAVTQFNKMLFHGHKTWGEWCLNARTDQFSLVQPLDQMGRLGDMRDDSAEILFKSFLHEALVNSSGRGRDVHSLTFSIQHFFCRPRRRPPSKVPWRMVWEGLSWRVTWLNHASFRLLTLARRGSCGPTRKLFLLRTQSLVLCS